MAVLEILKSKLNLQHIEAPKILQENFLDQNELTDIKRKVLNLKNHWEYLDPNSKDTVPVRFLSAGAYTRTLQDYEKSVVKFRPLMLHNFSYYYDKIEKTVEQYFGKQTDYFSYTNFPGFHIFALNNDGSKGRYEHVRFHRDGFTLPGINDRTPIFSFLIPIDLPKTGSSLLYTFDSPVYLNRLDEKYTYHKFDYQLGSLIMWPGRLLHSIAPFEVSENEYRMTIQFHAACVSDSLKLFW